MENALVRPMFRFTGCLVSPTKDPRAFKLCHKTTVSSECRKESTEKVNCITAQQHVG